MKRVLIVGCGFPQLSLIRRAKALDLQVFGVDLNPAAVAVEHCDEFEILSTNDAAGLIALIKRTGIDSVTTTGSEVALKTVAHACAATDRRFYADPETVRRCQEKDAMREGYARGGVTVPSFVRCETVHAAVAFARAYGYPLVVKPARGWGQRGVARVDSEDDLVISFEDALAHAKSAGLAQVVIERFLVGTEYSVNGWIEDGELVSYCVTERLTAPGNKPLGVMLAELYPSKLSEVDEARVVDEARRGARALGHLRGPCYSQVALTADGPRLFETAARLGGGFDADVTYLASGVDLYRRVLGIATGDRALEREAATGGSFGAAVAKFLVGKPGMVDRISGLEDARALPGILDAQVFIPIGGQVMPLTDSAKRAAYVLARAESRTDVVTLADRALSTIRIETRDANREAAHDAARDETDREGNHEKGRGEGARGSL